MGKLEVTLCQTDIVWEDREENFRILEAMLGEAAGSTDLAVLPETFTTGFTMNVEANAESEMESLQWMKHMSEQLNCAISGTLPVKEKEDYFNRHYLVQPDGLVARYDKRHLFRIGGESDSFTPGTKKVVVKLGSFRILLQTCYDLRFPVFSRYRGDYDAILYAANWPGGRQQVWETLLKARAIENQCYVIGINRAGKDRENITYKGGSCLVDPLGNVVQAMGESSGIMNCSMDIKKVRDLRRKFPVSEDADQFFLSGID